ncbi:MAG: ribonuclease H-like domain-containing protein [Syntrophales bacterium]
MSTIKRLQRLTGEDSPKQKKSPRADEISELRKRIEAITSRRPMGTQKPASKLYKSRIPLHDVIRGEEVVSAFGKFFIVHRHHEGSSKHGNRRIREIAALDMKAAAILANNADIASFGCKDALFLDTETTGLAGGTGTFAFLIGVGWFEDDTFRTQQLFARDFSEERACLNFLLEMAREKSFLVTYNGRAFDVGLLSTRFILNRLPDGLTAMPNLDLLHPARRLFGHRLENNRLSTMEKDIIGFHRYGDIPGSEIPQRYFDWLRYRDPRLLDDVFEHNRLDVISMAALAVYLAEILSPKPDMATREHLDLLAAARLLLDRGDLPSARTILEALIKSDETHVAFEARKSLSLIHKRHGRWIDAIKIWETILLNDPGNFFAVDELAKYLEHRQRNFRKAIEIISAALSIPHCKTASERDALVYRLKRLRSRAGIVNNE